MRITAAFGRRHFEKTPYRLRLRLCDRPDLNFALEKAHLIERHHSSLMPYIIVLFDIAACDTMRLALFIFGCVALEFITKAQLGFGFRGYHNYVVCSNMEEMTVLTTSAGMRHAVGHC